MKIKGRTLWQKITMIIYKNPEKSNDHSGLKNVCTSKTLKSLPYIFHLSCKPLSWKLLGYIASMDQ